MTNQYWAEADAYKAEQAAKTEAALLRIGQSLEQERKDKEDLLTMMKLVRAVKLGVNTPTPERARPILRNK